MTDDELEDLFRVSFANHAATAPTGAQDPAAAARAGLRRRRLRRTGVAAVVTAAVIAVPIAVVAATSGGGATPVAAPGQHYSSSAKWRTESYNGIELRVPSFWGWAAAPTTLWEAVCLGGQPSATSEASGSAQRSWRPYRPYVGRPIGDAFVCPGPMDGLVTSSSAHVWFDSPLAAEGGQHESTVSVHGLTDFTITVADPNPARLASILGSIRTADVDANGCTSLPRRVQPNDLSPAGSTFTAMSVCVYDKRDATIHRTPVDPGYLYYSTRIGPSATSRAISLIEASRWPPHAGACASLIVGRGLSLLALVARSAAGTLHYFIQPDVCGGLVGYFGAGHSHPLTKPSARVWAVGGVPLYAGNATGANDLAQFLPTR